MSKISERMIRAYKRDGMTGKGDMCYVESISMWTKETQQWADVPVKPIVVGTNGHEITIFQPKK